MNGILKENRAIELSLSLMNCSVLGAVIFYLLLLLSLTRYEVNTRYLSISRRGKRVIIPLRHILDVSFRQNWIQKILNTADIIVEASVAGELRQVRMRHISGFKNRVEQIRYLLQEQT